MKQKSAFYISFLILVLISVPIKGQAINDYRSAASTDWNVLTTWERWSGFAWVTPTAGEGTPNSTDGAITIRNGHTLTVTANVTVDQVVVDTGGQITVNSGVTLSLNNGTGTDLTVNGNIIISGNISIATSALFEINSTGTVNTGGSIFGTNNVFLTVGINGNLTVFSTGNGIGGSLGQSWGINIADGNGGAVLQVDGSLTIDGATVRNEHNNSIIVNGTVSILGTGNLTSTRGNGGSVGEVKNEGLVTLSDNATWTITTGTITIENGGFLALGSTSVVNGSGTLDLDPGSTLRIGSTAGIRTSPAATGNVQSSGRVFDAGANYTYNGTAAQVTGDGLPTNLTGTLTINNPSGVTLSVPITISTGTLALTSGNLITTTNLLTIGATGTTGGSSASYIVGNLAHTYSTTGSKIFPIGSAAAYRPVTINATTISGSGTLTIKQTDSPPGHTTIPASVDKLSEVRYWTMTKAAGITSVTANVTLTWGSDDGVTDLDNATIVGGIEGGNWDVENRDGGTTGNSTLGTVTGEFTATSITSDLTFGNLTGGTNPLPVELISFNAALDKNNVLLNWETKTEVQNYGFDIEKAAGSKELGGNWKKIGFVRGHGNSNSPKEYSFVDSKLTFGIYYYRLKQIDTDGGFEYSKVVEVDFSVTDNFSLEQNYPNPFNPATTIKFAFDKNTKAQLKVYDVLGNEIANLFNETIEAGKIYEINFDASSLSSGVYYYQLSGDNKTEIKKMLLLK